jgi:single-strand DNA-binding protein
METLTTIMGNATDEPRLRRTGNGHAVASFRIASTPRRYDAQRGEWVNRPTLYITVSCWRALAQNVAVSVFKGQPVIVTGRLQMREYEKNEVKYTTYEIDAVSVGHDLTRGTTVFSKADRGPLPAVALDEQGLPADDSDHYLGVEEGEDPFAGRPVEEEDAAAAFASV